MEIGCMSEHDKEIIIDAPTAGIKDVGDKESDTIKDFILTVKTIPDREDDDVELPYVMRKLGIPIFFGSSPPRFDPRR